jgi:hypothetical protein
MERFEKGQSRPAAQSAANAVTRKAGVADEREDPGEGEDESGGGERKGRFRYPAVGRVGTPLVKIAESTGRVSAPS